MVARTLQLLCLLAVCGSAMGAQSPSAVDSERTAELIEQLGSPEYLLRRDAQRELTAAGLAAFDQLVEARQHRDPEIATTAHRLLARLAIQWSRPGDSARVRKVLDVYGVLDEEQRLQAVTELASISGSDGVAALCRITRFDLSDQVAQQAAVRLMASAELDPPADQRDRVRAGLKALRGAYGPSRRAPIQWLEWFANDPGADGPAGDQREWGQALSQSEAAAANPRVLRGLRWSLLRSQLAGRDQESAVETIGSLVAASPGSDTELVRAVEWLLEVEADAAIDQVFELQEENLQDKRGLYLIARTRRSQGRAEEAEALADKALATPADAADAIRSGNQTLLDGGVRIGLELQENSLREWAREEFRAALNVEGLDCNKAYAGWVLADSLQDGEEYAAASEVLTGLLAEIQATPDSQSRYERLVRQYSEPGTAPLQPVVTLRARAAYFGALAARSAGDAAAELTALEAAIKADPDDADVLIAMHRVPDASPEYRADVSERIREAAARVELQMRDDPNSPHWYNLWAWLVSNTEGDFQKALRYSQKSLRLQPGEPTYLDTLGRCYYAAGELEKAVEAQRQAVSGQPQYQVMQRQLRFFEQELEKANAPGTE